MLGIMSLEQKRDKSFSLKYDMQVIQAETSGFELCKRKGFPFGVLTDINKHRREKQMFSFKLLFAVSFPPKL